MSTRAEISEAVDDSMRAFIRLAAEGLTSTELAEELDLSAQTCRNRARKLNIVLAAKPIKTHHLPCACGVLVHNSEANGHRFGSHLRCRDCETTWEREQLEPTLCRVVS